VQFLGFGIPIIFLLLFSLNRDFSQLRKEIPRSFKEYNQKTSKTYEDFILAVERLNYSFISMFGRYSWVLLFISVIVFYEYSFASGTLAESALYWTYGVYLLPILFVMLLLGGLWAYERTYARLALYLLDNQFDREDIEDYEAKYNPRVLGQRVYNTYLALLFTLTVLDAIPLVKGIFGQGLYDLLTKFFSH